MAAQRAAVGEADGARGILAEYGLLGIVGEVALCERLTAEAAALGKLMSKALAANGANRSSGNSSRRIQSPDSGGLNRCDESGVTILCSAQVTISSIASGTGAMFVHRTCEEASHGRSIDRSDVAKNRRSVPRLSPRKGTIHTRVRAKNGGARPACVPPGRRRSSAWWQSQTAWGATALRLMATITK